MLDIFSYPESTMKPTVAGWEKKFHNGNSHMADILALGFTYTVFHKRAILLTFYAEYTESVLDILSYLESTMGPPWLVPLKEFFK